MALEETGVKLTAEGADGFVSDMKKAEKANEGFVGSIEDGSRRTGGASEIMIGALRKVGEVAVEALGAAVKAVGDFVTDSVKIAADFETGMSVLQATIGANADDMKALSDRAIELGNDLTLPGVSASSAANAMIALAKAGVGVNDTLAASRGVLQLATAAHIDEAKAAEIVAHTLHAFHLEGDKATKVADMLAAASKASGIPIEQLAEGVQQGGFAFQAAGQKSDDLIASLGILTKVGLTGSDAGTALKNAFVRLMNPTKQAAKLMDALGINVYDANGNMLPMRDIIRVLNSALAGMTQEQRNAALGTIFMSDGMKAMIPLLDGGVEGFDKMQAKVNEQGAAAKLAAAQMAGFNGAMEGLGNTVDTLKLAIGTKLLPILTEFINNTILPAVQTISRFADAFLNATDKVGFLELVLSELIPGSELTINQIHKIVVAVFEFITSFNQVGTLGGLFSQLAGTVQTVVSLITSIVGELVRVIAEWVNENKDDLENTFGEAWQTVQSIFETASKIIVTILAQISGFINTHGETIKAILTVAWTVIKTVIKTTLDLIRGILQLALALLQGDWQSALDAMNETVERILNDIAGLFGTTLEDIQTNVANALAGVGASIQNELTTAYNDALTFVTKFGQFGTNLVQAIIDGINAIGYQIYNAIIDPINKALQAGFQGIIDFINSIIAILGGTPIGGGSKSGQSFGGSKTVSHVSAAGSSSTNNYTTSSARNYNLTVNSSQSASSLSSQFAIMEALAG